MTHDDNEGEEPYVAPTPDFSEPRPEIPKTRCTNCGRVRNIDELCTNCGDWYNDYGR